MTWREHYEELNPKDYSFTSNTKIISIIIVIVLNIILYVYFWKFLTTKVLIETYISFSIFSFISICFPIVIFKFILLYPNTIKIFYNKNNDSLLDFNQKKYLDEKVKNLKSNQKIFFVTWLGKKEENSKLKRAIYFYANYKYIQYLKKYEVHSYTLMYLVTIFTLTAIAFWGLILILTITPKSINPNAIFLFSIFYILYIIFVSYITYSEKEQDLFFKENLRGFPENYFLLDSNLDTENKEEKKSFDVLAIVFGVLFTLYITLAYSTIYTVSVDIKKISIESKFINKISGEK